MSVLGRLLTAVVTVRIALSLILWMGSLAVVSDDDFARVVIAQGFSVTPRLDPSGSSWLPLPFYVMGTAMIGLAPSLLVARLVALGLAALSALGVYVAGTWLGLGRRSAACAALAATLLPHAAWLGAATVPDYPTAVLILLGAASLATDTVRIRGLGALALATACFSRYEAWPVAAAFAILTGVESVRTRRLTLLAPIALSLVAPLLWLAHGVAIHHDAWFFLERVESYHRALGGKGLSLGFALLSQLASLLAEPELLILVALFALMFAVRRRREKLTLVGSFGKLWLALFALFAFRVAGEYLGGGPTHHPERPLLALWLALILFGAGLLEALLTSFPSPRRLALLLFVTAVPLVVLVAMVIRPKVVHLEPLNRDRELAIAGVARARVPKKMKLGICTRDYGAFAIQAGFGRPKDAQLVCDRDPRRKIPDPLRSPEALIARLRDHQLEYLVAPRDALAWVDHGFSVLASRADFVLVRSP